MMMTAVATVATTTNNNQKRGCCLIRQGGGGGYYCYYDDIRRRLNPQPFANFILCLIVINSIMMGIATFPFVKNDSDMEYKFDLVDKIFLIIFTIESTMQLIHHGIRGFFQDGFRVFDLLIVILSWAMEGTQVIRAFRIFRATRLITRLATMRNLILAIFSVIPKMTAIFLLLSLLFFIFGVMFTTLFKEMYEEGELTEPYFDSLFYSFFTLFQMMTMDAWSTVLKQIQEIYPIAWIPFVVFIVLTGFVVVNLIIAIICDAVHVVGGVSGKGKEVRQPPEKVYVDDGYHVVEQTVVVEGGVFSSSSSYQQQQCTTTSQRIEELQKQLDEMIVAQDQMRKIIEVLSSKASKMTR